MLPKTRQEAQQKNESRYLGKPCTRGHNGERYTVNSTCVHCSRKSQQRQQQNADNAARYLVYGARHRAKRDGIEFNITVEDVVIPTHCPCCNVPLKRRSDTARRGRKYANGTHASLDRKVPHLGYVRGNIGVICMRCNSVKNAITEEMLHFLVEYIKIDESLLDNKGTQDGQEQATEDR